MALLKRREQTSDQPGAPVPKRSLKSRVSISKSALLKVLGGLVVVALLVGVYYVGDHHGAKRQRALDAKRSPAARASTANPSTHKIVSGNITDINDKQATVKSTDGKTQTVKFDKNTTYSDATGKKIELKDVKKDAKVLITANVEKDNSYTAQRVRLQK